MCQKKQKKVMTAYEQKVISFQKTSETNVKGYMNNQPANAFLEKGDSSRSFW